MNSWGLEIRMKWFKVFDHKMVRCAFQWEQWGLKLYLDELEKGFSDIVVCCGSVLLNIFTSNLEDGDGTHWEWGSIQTGCPEGQRNLHPSGLSKLIWIKPWAGLEPDWIKWPPESPSWILFWDFVTLWLCLWLHVLSEPPSPCPCAVYAAL